jgi:hypothetical protein
MHRDDVERQQQELEARPLGQQIRKHGPRFALAEDLR